MSVPKFWLYLYDRLAGLPCSPGSTGDLCGNLSANCGTAAGRGVTISGSPCGAECGLPSRFFCACLCVESGLPSRFFCARTRVESGLPCGASPADSGWSIRSARGGLCGGGAGHAPQVSRAGGGKARSADGDSRRRAGSGSVFWSARRARKGFRETGCIRCGALSAADRVGWKAHPGVGGKTKSGFREKTAFVV